jgi:Glycosyltransferase like family
MIGFGVCIGPRDVFSQLAAPAISAMWPESPVFTRTNQKSIFRAYNSILDEASAASLDALVLIHDDVELKDPGLPAKLRVLFDDDTVGVVGVVGGVGVKGVGWWQADQCLGRAVGGLGVHDYGGGTHEVDAVDGMFMALSPWVVRNVRFDDRAYRGFHGYDTDFCFEVRRRERRVFVSEIDLFHHSKRSVGDSVAYRRSELVFDRKWIAPKKGWQLVDWKIRYRLATKGPALRRRLERLPRIGRSLLRLRRTDGRP